MFSISTGQSESVQLRRGEQEASGGRLREGCEAGMFSLQYSMHMMLGKGALLNVPRIYS